MKDTMELEERVQNLDKEFSQVGTDLKEILFGIRAFLMEVDSPLRVDPNVGRTCSRILLEKKVEEDGDREEGATA